MVLHPQGFNLLADLGLPDNHEYSIQNKQDSSIGISLRYPDLSSLPSYGSCYLADIANATVDETDLSLPDYRKLLDRHADPGLANDRSLVLAELNPTCMGITTMPAEWLLDTDLFPVQSLHNVQEGETTTAVKSSG